MGKITHKVLVLGVDERSTLTVVRSLGRKGIHVHLGYDDNASICRHSRFTEKCYKFPYAGDEPEAWLKCLKIRIAAEPYDLVIPTADNYLVLAVKNRASLENFAKFAIPCDRGFEYTYKKNKTFELAKSLDIPIPKTMQINSVAEFNDLQNELIFPIIIKPISSKVWKDNIRHSLKVETAKNEKELKAKLLKMLSICPVLLQSFHRGVGVGIEMLMNDGKLVAAFQHQRVHEPIKGGGSSYRKSVKISPALLDYSVKIMNALNWTGVTMVEYKYNEKTQESVLMEINGRFWGSLPLAYNSGIDFPAWLYDLMVCNKSPENVNFRENLFCRNIVRDLDWFVENLFADKKDPLKISVPLHTVFKEIGNIMRFNERFDALAVDDMKPGVIHLSRYFCKKMQGLLVKIHKLIIKLNREYNSVLTLVDRRRLAKKCTQNLNVLFICKGNICRSPFAEYYLKNKLRSVKDNFIEVESVGLIEKINRESPESAIEAGKYFNVNLKKHKSKILDKKKMEDFGIIFVMDIELYTKVVLMYPKYKNKLFYLGAFQKGYPNRIQINDPYGKDVKTFTFIYSQIAHSIDNFIERFFVLAR